VSNYAEQNKILDSIVLEDSETKEKNVQPEQTKGKGLVETLSSNNNFSVVEKYMSERFGMDTDEYDKEDIIDSYVNQMRKFNSGQSVVTVGELTFLNSGDDKKLLRKRNAAKDAYQLFDSLDGAFSKDRTVVEKADAVYDYARAIVVDPVNILSLGVGKLFAMGASKAAVMGAKQIAFRVGRQAAFKELKKSGSKKAAMRVQRETTQRALQEALKKSKTKALVDGADKKSIYGSLTFDMAAAGGMDVAQQKAEVTSGFKEEIDFFQSGVSTLTGALGGVTQLGLVVLKNKKQIPLASIQLHRSNQIKEATDDTISKLSKEERKKVLASKDVTKKLLDLKKRTAEWQAKVKKGKELAKVSDDPKASLDYDTEFVKMFFEGSVENEFDGIFSILAEAGYKQPRDMNFTDFLGEAVLDLSGENKKIIVDAYKILRESSGQLKGFNLEEFIKIDAGQISEGARILGLRSQAKQKFRTLGLDKTLDEVEAGELIKTITDPIDPKTKESFYKKGKTFQENLVRAIVTHPGTTALNGIGWKAATINQSVSDMIRAGLYGGNAVLKTLTGDSVNALKYKNLSVQMMDLQRQKVRNMVDPYGTYESVMDYLAIRPDAQKELFRYINGGVELKGILDEFQLNPNTLPDKGNLEKFNDVFEKAYGVKAQDFLTKTQEFHYALDKEIRLNYGKSYNEFMNDPDLVRYLSEPGSERFKEFAKIEATAVQNALRNTFSKKYGGRDGFIQTTANAIEEFRSVPVLGTLAPFGQFWNNSVAFMLDHSGMSLLNKYTIKVGGDAIKDRDTLDLFTKSAVGWGAVGVATVKQMDNLEEGLAWFEGRDEAGAVRSYLYDYPKNVPMLVGRMGAHLARDGSIPSDLITAFGDNFGARALTRDVGEAFGIVGKSIHAAAEAKDADFLELGSKFLGDLTSQYISGFSRKFDPINQGIAMIRGEDFTVVDRKQGNETFNNSLRYVDQIYTVLSGEELAEEKEKALTREPGQVPIGRLTGYREVLPSTTIEKLYNDVGKPQWKTEIKSKSPEAVNTFNEIVRPRLEVLADFVIESGEWDKASLKEKQSVLQAILSRAKRETMETLDRSVDPEEKKTKLIFSVKNKGTKAELNKALDYFNIAEKDMWTLDTNQLLLLEDFVENFSGNRKQLLEDLGLD